MHMNRCISGCPIQTDRGIPTALVQKHTSLRAHDFAHYSELLRDPGLAEARETRTSSCYTQHLSSRLSYIFIVDWVHAHNYA